MLRDFSGEIYDIIAGTFFLCAAPKDSASFEGLTENQVRAYSSGLHTRNTFSVPVRASWCWYCERRRHEDPIFRCRNAVHRSGADVLRECRPDARSLSAGAYL
ncbi:MAG: hypothetical protein ACLUIW_06080 [Dysosmobacter welbionis]